MLFLLVEMKHMLDLVAKALAIGRVGMAAMLLFVDVASAASLSLVQPGSRHIFHGYTYPGMELILRVALVDLGDHVDRPTLVRLRPDARRLTNVANSTATSGKLAVKRFALDTFTEETSVRVNRVVSANVAGACIDSQLALLRKTQGYHWKGTTNLHAQWNELACLTLTCCCITDLNIVWIMRFRG